MPRDRKPDPRTGRHNARPAGEARPQRTDRNNAATQPARAPSGLQYGQRQRVEQAQQAQPLPDAAARWQATLESARGLASGQAVPLRQASGRPGEPVTAGLNVGPGPGPEAIRSTRPATDPSLAAAARWLPMWEAHAAQPEASAAFRQWVRQIRSQLPVDLDPAQVLAGGQQGV